MRPIRRMGIRERLRFYATLGFYKLLEWVEWVRLNVPDPLRSCLVLATVFGGPFGLCLVVYFVPTALQALGLPGAVVNAGLLLTLGLAFGLVVLADVFVILLMFADWLDRESRHPRDEL